MFTYIARSVGIPARQVGTPCWNQVTEGVDYRGLAAGNPNVSLCWRGGSDARGHVRRQLSNPRPPGEQQQQSVLTTIAPLTGGQQQQPGPSIVPATNLQLPKSLLD